MYDIFSIPDFSFPDEFLFGSATAGHQIDGFDTSSDQYFEELHNPRKVPAGAACNGYALFREDAHLVKALGHQAYRFSIEWCRVEPLEGHWDDSAIKHYEEQLSLLAQLGIQPWVTLCHFSLPKWFADKGGFEKVENIDCFLRYVEKMVRHIGKWTDHFLILNEWFQAEGSPLLCFNRIKAHARAYTVIKSLCNKAVGSAQMALQYCPLRPFDELDNLYARMKHYLCNGVIRHAVATGELAAPGVEAQSCPEIRGAMDFWGLNLYTRTWVDSRRENGKASAPDHKRLRMIDRDFYLEEMYPEGMTAMLEYFNDRPVFITENGCSCNNDEFRIVYMVLYLSAINDALKQGCDVRGYFYWSLLDNYEWGSYLPRFGLVSVNRETFQRTPKPSALFYRELIKARGFRQDILLRYLQHMPSLVIS